MWLAFPFNRLYKEKVKYLVVFKQNDMKGQGSIACLRDRGKTMLCKVPPNTKEQLGQISYEGKALGEGHSQNKKPTALR